MPTFADCLCAIHTPVDPTRLVLAQWQLMLIGSALMAVLLGWVLARMLRHRWQVLATDPGPHMSHTDAWAESAARIGSDDDTVDLDPPRDSPPRDPNPRWRS
ncbi:MAG: hypothetical protein H6814_11210 [Phycisphaeraceae bacterium]|nr:hypothetical protein [Phycisphaeraceae bacterium]